MKELSEIFSRLLDARGISAATAEDFLHPSLAQLARPEDLAGIPEAAEVILAAVREGKRIVVFGDYDCDGISAAAIMVKTITILGGKVAAFIPRRLTEGYGMTDASVTRMRNETPDVKLVVTVDNGINSIAEIAALKGQGIGTVVTDHHLPGKDDAGRPVLPAALAIVNPKVDAGTGAFEHACGAFVAFLLANRLVDRARETGLYSGGSVAGPLLVLAALATVTDSMPLLGQNRILVAEALKRFPALAPIGLKELYARAARDTSAALTSRDFGFVLGPRMNAAGRVADAFPAFELVCSNDSDIAREDARIVEDCNSERKRIETEMLKTAMARLVPEAPAQVLDLPEGHIGVAGIVATRVMNALDNEVPVAIVVGIHGSARAPDDYDVRGILERSSASLSRFGGHRLAAGFSVKPGETDRFRAKFAEAAAAQRAECGKTSSGKDRKRADLLLRPEEVTLAFAEELRLLEPFGEGNPVPTFGFSGVSLREVRTLGADSRHLAFTIEEGGLRAVWWNPGEGVIAQLTSESSADATYDLVATLEISTYGVRHVELRIVTLESATGSHRRSL